jgi:hypothetical protein
MGVALDASKGFETSQNLNHSPGFEAKWSLGGPMRTQVLLKTHPSEWANAYLPLFGSLIPDRYGAFFHLYVPYPQTRQLR